MIRNTLQAISQLLETYEGSSNTLAAAAVGDDEALWKFLVSNELWGGAGSIADQALLKFPEARKALEVLMIRIGREQMAVGRVNVRTQMWVSAFEKWQIEGIR